MTPNLVASGSEASWLQIEVGKKGKKNSLYFPFFPFFPFFPT